MRWQNTFFVEQRGRNSDAKQREQEQTNRQDTVFSLHTFVFSAVRQQVDQFNIGDRPNIEKHDDKKDDCETQHGLAKRSG